MKRLLTTLIFAGFCFVFTAKAQDYQSDKNRQEYKSPYHVEFSYSLDDLIGDIISGSRGNPKDESQISYFDWDSSFIRKKYGGFGPPIRHYPEFSGLSEKSPEWKRQRLIAVGLRFLGYPYQHHHVPDWAPPEDWPWKQVGEGRNTKGLDCSNFTTFIYDMAFGYRTSSDIKKQSEQLKIHIGRGEERYFEAKIIERPESYEDFPKKLRTADLLYIKSHDEITHVIIWVGDIGRSPDGTPLVLDSTGGSRKDCNGASIPNGIYLRPFSKDSWYFKGMDHAIRIIHGD